jgi:GNAT superfamily N-acetyltransferase
VVADLVTSRTAIRPVEQHDFAQWLPLWQGYCAFYGRPHDPALPPDDVTMTTWARFFDAAEPVHALVAARDGQLVGLAHYIFHRNTGTIGPVCYLQDLFTTEAARGHGVGRALIEGVYAAATSAGAERVYWQTQHSTRRRWHSTIRLRRNSRCTSTAVNCGIRPMIRRSG